MKTKRKNTKHLVYRSLTDSTATQYHREIAFKTNWLLGGTYGAIRLQFFSIDGLLRWSPEHKTSTVPAELPVYSNITLRLEAP